MNFRFLYNLTLTNEKTLDFASQSDLFFTKRFVITVFNCGFEKSSLILNTLFFGVQTVVLNLLLQKEVCLKV